jgi:hypothetical protein
VWSQTDKRIKIQTKTDGGTDYGGGRRGSSLDRTATVGRGGENLRIIFNGVGHSDWLDDTFLLSGEHWALIKDDTSKRLYQTLKGAARNHPDVEFLGPDWILCDNYPYNGYQ